VNLGPKINTSAVESDPFWDAPRKRLYFERDADIWYADWTDTSWANPVKLGPQLNTGPDGEKSPSVSPDGQKLYFVAGARQGFLWDIWVSTWNPSANDWGTPVNVGPPVNTSGVEFSAKLSPDGQSLYFDSDGDLRCGFYVSRWNGSGWSAPQPVLIPGGECGLIEYPSVTADGRWIYFDQFVNDGKSSFVSRWNGSAWEQAVDLRPQVGERSGTPFITPSGDSLFIASGAALGGFGSLDIFLMERKVPPRVPALSVRSFFLLIFLLAVTAFWWIWKRAKYRTLF
jgi:Tol biopolymer transport system component